MRRGSRKRLWYVDCNYKQPGFEVLCALKGWMEDTGLNPVIWTNTRALGMAAISLVLGIGVGFVLRAIEKPKAEPSNRALVAAVSADPMPRHTKIPGEAADNSLASLKKDPNNPELLAQVARDYLQRGEYKQAINYYERAANAGPTADRFVNLSNAYHFSDADDRAIEALNRALQRDPNSADALFNLGMLTWQAKNDPKGATAYWKRLLKSNPNHPRRAQVEALIAKAQRHAGPIAVKNSDLNAAQQ